LILLIYLLLFAASLTWTKKTMKKLKIEHLLSDSDTSHLKPTIYSGASASAVSLPAAAKAEAPECSPAGNTGNTSYSSGKPYKRVALSAELKDRLASSSFFEAEASKYSGHSLVKVDWLTVSFASLDSEVLQHVLSELYDLLYESCISVVGRGRGLYNYESSAQLKVLGDSGLDVSVGNIAHSDKQGVMLELSGKGCDQMAPKFKELYVLCQSYNARITRLDLALDLDSDYCKANNFTVPREGVLAQSGVYASRFASRKQRIQTVGSWNDLIFSGVTCDQYDPFIHGHGGLTLYVGAQTSENQIVLYEKGKQLLGGIPEDDLKMIMQDYRKVSERKRKSLIDSGFDPYYLDKLGWVRIERRIRRGGNKKDIPLQFMLDADSAFCLDFPRLQAVYSSYAEYVQREVDLVEYRAKRKANDKNILVSKKLFWAKRQYGRLVKTLIHEGFTASEVCDSLMRSQLVKDYVFDIVEDESIQPISSEQFGFEDYLTTQERETVGSIRSSYLSGADDAFSYRKNPLYTRLVNARIS
jgi:DNA relaxase NicK